MTHGADIGRSALIVVDMQNDFLHPDGALACRARERPAANIDLAFLQGTIPRVQQLVHAFRAAGQPVAYIAHAMQADYADAQFPYWRIPVMAGRDRLVEGSWGARIVEQLTPAPDARLVIKKGYNGFANTPLDTILRHLGVSTCVVSGVMTCVCVSSTVRGGVERNYRMVVAGDACAEINREGHEAELKVLRRAFADVLTTAEVVARLVRPAAAS